MHNRMKFRLFPIVLLLLFFIMTPFAGCTAAENGGSGGNNQNIETDAIDILNNNNWVDANRVSTNPDNDYAGLKSYTFSEGANKFNPVKSNKALADAEIKLSLAGLDLGEYKKLVIKAKGSEAGSDMIVKLEASPRINGGEGYESVNIILDKDYSVFEFDISFENYEAIRAGLTYLTIIPGAGNKNFDTDIYISVMKFSKLDPVPARVVNLHSKNIEIPNIYDGTSETFNINKNFINQDGETAYSIKYENSANIVTVKTGKALWSGIRIPVEGNLKGFNALKLSYKGPEGKSFKIKFEGNGITSAETGADIACNGAVKEYIWSDFSDVNLPDSGNMFVYIFIEPNRTVTETFTIEFRSIEFVALSDITTPNDYNGTDSVFNINKRFVSHDGDVPYLIEYRDGKNIITVNTGKQAYSFIKIPVQGNLRSLTSLYVSYKGPAGATFKFKLEGGGVTAKETNPDPSCDGTEQTFTWTNFGAANLIGSGSMNVMLFINPGQTVTAPFTFEIYQLEFRK